MNEEKIAIVSHYHNKIGVTTIVLVGNLSIGDSLRIQGGSTDFTQNIDSMQQAGNHIAIEAKEYTREGDIGHRVNEGLLF